MRTRFTTFTKDIIFHPLFSGSAIMVIGANLSNFLAYLYHLILGRILEPREYGELAASISLLGLFTVSFIFFSTVIVKFVSAAQKDEVQDIFIWFIRKLKFPTIAIGLILFISSSYISKFLNADLKSIALIGPILVLSAFSIVFRSVLQGLLRFKEVVIISNLEMVVRLLLGVLFVFLGFSVFGAFLGLFLAALIALVFTRYYLKGYKLFGEASSFKEGSKVFFYAVPIFFASFATNSFFSTDLILVKHFFDPHNAGIYAALSSLGKIIFFGASPVGAVMFPMISKRHALGQRYKKIFFLSVLLTLAISGSVLFVYYFAPNLAIRMLYGSKYVEAAPYLFWFGLFMAIFTLDSLIINYFLSKNETRVSYLAVLFAAIQIIGIWSFHESLMSVIKVSIVATSLFFICLLLYFGYEEKSSKIA